MRNFHDCNFGQPRKRWNLKSIFLHLHLLVNYRDESIRVRKMELDGALRFDLIYSVEWPQSPVTRSTISALYYESEFAIGVFAFLSLFCFRMTHNIKVRLF